MGIRGAQTSVLLLVTRVEVHALAALGQVLHGPSLLLQRC